MTGWNGKTTISERNNLYAKLQSNDRVAMEVCTLALIMASEMEKKVHSEVQILNAEHLPIISLPSEKGIRRRKLLAEYRQLKQH